MPFCNWQFVIPADDVVKLSKVYDSYDALVQENHQLRREVDALHNLYRELVQMIADSKRQ